jgi:anthranilate synthase component 1
MLVDLARNDIGRVSVPGSVKVESFQKLRKFGGVMHLVSKVTGKVNSQTDSIGALASCFPPGTLSGAPKIRAMSLLSELEPESRGFYGGAFIAASVTGDLDSCIAIRCMSIENGVVTIQAGAGIVADSSPEKEYQEIEHKSRLARKALALALSKRDLGATQ